MLSNKINIRCGPTNELKDSWSVWIRDCVSGELIWACDECTSMELGMMAAAEWLVTASAAAVGVEDEEDPNPPPRKKKIRRRPSDDRLPDEIIRFVFDEDCDPGYGREWFLRIVDAYTQHHDALDVDRSIPDRLVVTCDREWYANNDSLSVSQFQDLLECIVSNAVELFKDSSINAVMPAVTRSPLIGI